MNSPIVILGIESSCDDTAAAILVDGKIYSNEIATQAVHKKYGGVVPELASRAHQANIVPVIEAAIQKAGIQKSEITAVAFTKGPGLLGSLLVGSSFAQTFALANNIPAIPVHHMEAHIHALFIQDKNNEENYSPPPFPFLCMTVSGGHTQIVLVNDFFEIDVIGETLDDAAGEAFDKIGKMLGLPYPSGPEIDKLAQSGNPHKFIFPVPTVAGYDFSFSGFKTSVLYFLKKGIQANGDFIEENKNDICASVQFTIVKILTEKLLKAANEKEIKHLALAGGVSANSALRKELYFLKEKFDLKIYTPSLEYCTDNAAMIAMSGYLFLKSGNSGSDKGSVSVKT